MTTDGFQDFEVCTCISGKVGAFVKVIKFHVTDSVIDARNIGRVANRTPDAFTIGGAVHAPQSNLPQDNERLPARSWSSYVSFVGCKILNMLSNKAMNWIEVVSVLR